MAPISAASAGAPPAMAAAPTAPTPAAGGLAPHAAAAAAASTGTAPYDHSERRFAPGPLDAYRRAASFDWFKLKRSWFGDDIIEYMDKVWGLMEKDPLFRQPLAELEVRFASLRAPRARNRNRSRSRPPRSTARAASECAARLQLSRDEMRHLTLKQMKRYIEWGLVSDEELMSNPVAAIELPCILGAYDWSSSAKIFLHLQSTAVPRLEQDLLSGGHAVEHMSVATALLSHAAPAQCLRAPSRRAARSATSTLLKSATTSSTSAASA